MTRRGAGPEVGVAVAVTVICAKAGAAIRISRSVPKRKRNGLAVPLMPKKFLSLISILPYRSAGERFRIGDSAENDRQ
ncbi:MAG TPA: hypothetical protein PKG55_07465 [Acidobacteriota bacterium]|nr:hypothetical protein [Acidobacteriota bacterium]